MNVLLINTYNYGGAAQACMRLHRGLLKQGISSRLLTLTGSTEIPEVYSFRSIFKSRSQRVIQKLREYHFNAQKQRQLSGLPKGFEPFQLSKAPFELTEHPLLKWADVINLHWVAHFLDYPTFFKKVNQPIVWTLHDMLPFTGGYHYEKGFPFESYSHLIRREVQTKKAALKNTDLSIIALNDWLCNLSKKSELFGKYPHHIIPNGLDTTVFKIQNKRFSKRIFNIPNHKRCLLFVADSVTNKRKGFNLLMEAINQMDHNNIHLAIIGGNTNQFNHLENVTAIGKIKDERLMALAYNAADLFIIPSIEDNLPNTVMESLACGTPVVGFNIGGIPQMVKPDFNGLLAEDTTIGDLKITIEKALNTVFQNQKIEADAHSRFDDSVQAKAYIDLFSSILGHNQ